MNPYIETKRSLAMAIDALADPIANAEGWYQAYLLDVHERLYRLWETESDAAQSWESERPRREAEIRLAHHIEHDTLDLY